MMRTGGCTGRSTQTGGIWKYHYITASDAALPDMDLLMKYGSSKDSCVAVSKNSTVVATVMIDPNGNPRSLPV